MKGIIKSERPFFGFADFSLSTPSARNVRNARNVRGARDAVTRPAFDLVDISIVLTVIRAIPVIPVLVLLALQTALRFGFQSPVDADNLRLHVLSTEMLSINLDWYHFLANASVFCVAAFSRRSCWRHFRRPPYEITSHRMRCLSKLPAVFYLSVFSGPCRRRRFLWFLSFVSEGDSCYCGSI